MIAKQPTVGTCELLRFFSDRRRFPELTARGFAVISALLMYVNTTGRGFTRYRAYPTQRTLARDSRLSEPTVRKWLRYFRDLGWLRIERRRDGNRNMSNCYDVGVAAMAIIEQKRNINPDLKVTVGHRNAQ